MYDLMSYYVNHLYTYDSNDFLQTTRSLAIDFKGVKIAQTKKDYDGMESLYLQLLAYKNNEVCYCE